jgi:hypothetical protein
LSSRADFWDVKMRIRLLLRCKEAGLRKWPFLQIINPGTSRGRPWYGDCTLLPNSAAKTPWQLHVTRKILRSRNITKWYLTF